MSMILHIANDYSGSSVYKNLVTGLDGLGLAQTVYTPIRYIANDNKNKVDLASEDSRIIYSKILNSNVDRILYRHKIKKVFNDLESKVDLTKISLIHAHTWYSDGGVAYKIYKKYGVPYIVTVRNTDLNVFQRYLVHERELGRKILQNAKFVILISASYRGRISALKSLRPIITDLSKKIQVIPNGVDQFWIDNTYYQKKNYNGNAIFNILYVGRLNKNKNIHQLQKAVINLNKKFGRIAHLHLIGDGGNYVREVLESLEGNARDMTYHGKIVDKTELIKHYRNADVFAMPSKHETFGLVYVEAMLQGNPILYTANEGIDGFYEEKIGEKVVEFTIKEIESKILMLRNNLLNYSIPLEKIKTNHNWSEISKKYLGLYNKIWATV